MEVQRDFLELLGFDMSIKVLMCLDDPSDLVHVSAASRSWHRFVIGNGLCKQLCLKMFPELSNAARVVEVEVNGREQEAVDVGLCDAMEWESLKRDHRVYAFLARRSTSFELSGCLLDAISASSTDNDPVESIYNTLEPGDRVAGRTSYWSSTGQRDPTVPETLTYNLVSELCVVTEISIQPFQAFFQDGDPIYSAKHVRFRMGHLEAKINIVSDILNVPDDEADTNTFIWTYTSPEFPMAQENCLQKFELPEPVLCIGGILQIELLGRVQRQEMDGLFYICICHVEVMGRPLSPVFDVEILDPFGKFLLKYYPQGHLRTPPGLPEDESMSDVPILPAGLVRRHLRGWHQILDIVLDGNIANDEENQSDGEDHLLVEEDYESNDEFVV